MPARGAKWIGCAAAVASVSCLALGVASFCRAVSLGPICVAFGSVYFVTNASELTELVDDALGRESGHRMPWIERLSNAEWKPHLLRKFRAVNSLDAPSSRQRIHTQPIKLPFEFVIPIWIPTLAFGLLWLPFSRLGRRTTPGHCARCDYNLTGNTSGRCPECGTRTPASTP